MSDVLTVRNLSKSFNETKAVDDVNFGVEDEFFALLGPSGSGKTTTLRMIAGLEIADQGIIHLEGKDITLDPPEKRNINTVFQNYALFPHMTVFDNVAFGLHRKKIDSRKIKTEVLKFLEMVNLSDKAKRLPKQLSGGEKQRVALIRAIINKPKVLLLDEPLGSLDLKIRQKLAIDLVNIREQVGISFVYVTHDQTEALTMADKIVVMDKGRIIQTGNPKELYESPNCSFVANFIGTTNILKGSISKKEGELYKVDISGLSQFWGRTSLTGINKVSVGDMIDISVRPEKVRITKKKDNLVDYNELSGRVKEIIYIGLSTEFLVELKNKFVFRIFAQNISPEDEIWNIQWEDDVYLYWRFDKTILLSE